MKAIGKPGMREVSRIAAFPRSLASFESMAHHHSRGLGAYLVSTEVAQVETDYLVNQVFMTDQGTIESRGSLVSRTLSCQDRLPCGSSS